MKLLVDADGCPRDIRQIIIRAAVSRSLDAVFIADRDIVEVRETGFRMIVVESGADAADDRLVEEAETGDLTFSRDIILASRLVEKGAFVIDAEGGLYTRENIRERLSIRNAMTDLRRAGVYEKKGRKKNATSLFANTLDRTLSKLLAGKPIC